MLYKKDSAYNIWLMFLLKVPTFSARIINSHVYNKESYLTIWMRFSAQSKFQNSKLKIGVVVRSNWIFMNCCEFRNEITQMRLNIQKKLDWLLIIRFKVPYINIFVGFHLLASNPYQISHLKPQEIKYLMIWVYHWRYNNGFRLTACVSA